jgi:hypothetical protein
MPPMLRKALLAVIALTGVFYAAAVLAGDAHHHHNHNHHAQVKYIGSKTVPINYRPLSETYIVRSRAFDEGNVKFSGRNGRQAGRSENPTGDAVTEVFIYSN